MHAGDGGGAVPSSGRSVQYGWCESCHSWDRLEVDPGSWSQAAYCQGCWARWWDDDDAGHAGVTAPAAGGLSWASPVTAAGPSASQPSREPRYAGGGAPRGEGEPPCESESRFSFGSHSSNSPPIAGASMSSDSPPPDVSSQGWTAGLPQPLEWRPLRSPSEVDWSDVVEISRRIQVLVTPPAKQLGITTDTAAASTAAQDDSTESRENKRQRSREEEREGEEEAAARRTTHHHGHMPGMSAAFYNGESSLLPFVGKGRAFLEVQSRLWNVNEDVSRLAAEAIDREFSFP